MICAKENFTIFEYSVNNLNRSGDGFNNRRFASGTSTGRKKDKKD
jgi:hypothetical protein